MSSHCPISGKYVPRKNPSDGYVVLSPEGEEVRFCCPSHKTRYLRENPGSVEVNPVRVRESGGETYDSAATKIDGQRVVITFYRTEEDADNVWNVLLLVGATRKVKKAARKYADLPDTYRGRTTGRVGLKALLWAKDQIEAFQSDRPEAIVVVWPSDARRAKAYRALTRYGFQTGKYAGDLVFFRPSRFQLAEEWMNRREEVRKFNPAYREVPAQSIRLDPSVTQFMAQYLHVFREYPNLWIKGGGARDALITFYTDRTQGYLRATRPLRDIDLVLLGGSDEDKRNLMVKFQGAVQAQDIDLGSETLRDYFKSRDVGLNEVALRPESMVFTDKAIRDLTRGAVHPSGSEVDPYWRDVKPRVGLRSVLFALREGLDPQRSELALEAIGSARPFDLLIHLYKAFETGVEDDFFALITQHGHLTGVDTPEEALILLHSEVPGFSRTAQQERIYQDAVSMRDTDRWASLKANPVDLKGRHIPEKYLAGLSAKERKQRIAELTEQRDRKGKGDKRYKELASDRLARKKGLVKQSAYSQVAEERGIQIRYKGAQPDFKATARAALRYYKAKGDVDEIADLLEQSYDKGLAAWQTGGHRPGASQRNWGDARVHSLLVGGKTAWYPSADRKQVRQFPRAMKEGIIRQMPEVFKALKAQGRQKDINYLRPKYKAAMEKLR